MHTETSTFTFEVQKSDWSTTRVAEEALSVDLAENEVLFRVDSLALTANNISYAATGDSLGYWGFFPGEEGWGRIPGMGWGEVIASVHTDVPVGERVWGWFPYGTHLKIRAGKVNATRIVDVSPHREAYAPVYVQFDRASANPIYVPEREDYDSLLRGLFMTSWLVEDFLAVNGAFDATACLITSASSKTSVALAYSVKARGDLESIGITSARNIDFCKGLCCYDRVVTYDELDSLNASIAVVLVDMAGNVKVLSALHHHYADNMRHSIRIGATHHTEGGAIDDLPGARPQFFFAPTHVKSRSDEIGGAELMRRMGQSYVGFRDSCDSWLRIEYSRGADETATAYQAVLGGQSDPASGQIVSLWPAGGS